MTDVFIGEQLTGTLAACPDIRPDGIYLEGQRVIRLGLEGVGVGDVGDLIAYREMWDPFISAHYQLWEELNAHLEGSIGKPKCPNGLFSASDIQHLPSSDQGFCASLRLSRMYTSRTDPYGIWTRWNQWAGTSSAGMLINAKLILEDLQSTVMAVGGPYKDELLRIAERAGVVVELPDVPDFNTQQELISRLEGAIVSTKGVLQIIGYGAGESLKMAGTTTEAVAEGLQDAAKKIPEAIPTPSTWIGVAAVLAVVGGGLIVYYIPRRAQGKAA